MLASDHGFFWKEGRPTTLSSNANTTAAKWHRNEGIYALWGAGIGPSAGHTARGSVQQVCATLLALLGLAPGRGLQGPALPGTPVDTRAPAAVDYTETFRRPAAGAAKEGRDADALAKLKSLGYVGDSGPATSRTLGATRTPGSYNNEGIILKEKGREADAIAAFDNALALDPNLASALWNLSDLLFAKKDFDRSDALLVKAFANGLPDGPKFLIGRAIGYQRSGQTDRSLKLVDGALQVTANDSEMWLFRGRYRVDAGDCKGAAADFEQAERLQPDHAPAYASEGLARMCAGDRAGARKAFTRSLALDPNQPKIREFLKGLGETS